jgi:toxin ParE1/3/4
MTRIVRRPKAEQDLDDIYNWIADQSPANADRYIERIISTIRHVAEMPQMGALRLPNHPKIRSFPVGSHLVFYQLIDSGIEVLRVVHGARDWENDEEFF